MPLDGAGAEPRRGKAPLLPQQLVGIRDRRSKIIIYRGGYRSGKTAFLCAKAIDLGRLHWPYPVLAIEPSYPMIRSVFVATMFDLCSPKNWNMYVRWQESKKTLTIGRRYPITIWCRSADKPRSLEGLTVGSLVGDEWELWAREALIVAMARVSTGPEASQQIVLGGTPEGYGPGYQLLEKNPAPTTRILVSRTADNRHVRASYVSDMRSRLSDEEAIEKLEGERTAPSGRVYTRFDRRVHCGAPCVDFDPRRSSIEVWANFNTGKMTWAFVVVAADRRSFHVVGELVVEHTDSQAQAKEARAWLAAWLSKRPGGRYHSASDVREMRVPVICSASGGKMAALSHVKNLQEAGFRPMFGAEDPRVDDRVASVQKVLAERRITFDEKAADYVVGCIATQPKKADGTPDRDPDLALAGGADVIGHGVMWHSPAFKPATQYVEDARARRWEVSKKHGSGN